MTNALLSPSIPIPLTTNKGHGNDNDNNNQLFNLTKKEQWQAFKAMTFGGLMYIIVIQFLSFHNITNNNQFYHNDSDTKMTHNLHDQEKDQQAWRQPSWTCKWAPDSREECTDLLAHRLPPPVVPTSGFVHAGNQNADESTNDPTLASAKPRKQRWLFFGDSTMSRPFTMSNLDRYLIGEPLVFMRKDPMSTSVGSSVTSDDVGSGGNSGDPCWSNIVCEERHADRCDHGPVFNLQPVAEWQPPIFSPNFEGPLNWAVNNPYCSDCGGCDPHFLHCVPSNQQGQALSSLKASSRSTSPEQQCKEDKKLVYGGYMIVEFAKDVELQSPSYRTTQENIVWYLREHFNRPQLVTEWGKPVCVIGTGFHDMILLIKTDDFNMDRFVENVEWYLMLMKDECSHMIWVTNTAPSRENPKNWPQTIERTKEWNDGVRAMIENNLELLRMSSYVDVFDASLDIPHKPDDHIHLLDTWYGDIGNWFSTLITEKENV